LRKSHDESRYYTTLSVVSPADPLRSQSVSPLHLPRTSGGPGTSLHPYSGKTGFQRPIIVFVPLLLKGLVAVFAEFEREIRSERVAAGIEQARRDGRRFGRPRSASLKSKQVRKLFREGASKADIARRLAIGRTSVRRILQEENA
jgi:hypothetical protein